MGDEIKDKVAEGDMMIASFPEAFLARRTAAFQPSTIQLLSRLAQSRNAINLAEGFPDFPAPSYIKEAAIAAISADYNQYRHLEALCKVIAESFELAQGVKVDPDHVTLCCGQSEAFAASILAVVDEGDEVLLFDPCYETYGSCIALAGGIPVYVPMDPPCWNIKIENLEAAITPRTKAIVINSPHNPTGKVFNIQELSHIATLCYKYNLLAITDEVYEHITYGSTKHISLASLPGMLERTIITSSLSKTFSVTGWRIGWAMAPKGLSAAISNIHVKLTDSAPAPFQEAAVTALANSNTYYYSELRKEYERRLETIFPMLEQVGLKVAFKPEGSVFVFAELPDTYQKTDMEYVEELIEKAGVAIVPGCGFFHCEPAERKANYMGRYVRVAFCKELSTLRAAAEAMKKMCGIRWATSPTLCSHVRD